jgi:hypothetical protein
MVVKPSRDSGKYPYVVGLRLQLWLEKLMNMNRLTLLLLLLLIPDSNSLAQQLSPDELIQILGIKSWRVPMPKDESMEWSIEIVDFASHEYSNINTDRLNLKQKALIAIRDMGKDTYQFTLKQPRGTGQGDLEINVCSEREKKENSCDNSYNLQWHDVPKPFDGGTKFVIADIAYMLEPNKPRKQIILEPVHFRLEDIIKEKAAPQPQTRPRKDGNSGIIYGQDHAFTLTAPTGWVLDNTSGVSQGLQAVFYPEDSSWQKGTVGMYANAYHKKDVKEEPLEKVIADDIAEYKKKSPEIRVKNAEPLPTREDARAKGKKATIKYFTGDASGNYEAVAYIDEGKVVVMLVLTARNEKDFESSLSSFKELVGSYLFLGDKPTFPQ